MNKRYRCLVVDHDDTSVMSTPRIHYPAHVEAMRRLRPGQTPVDLHGFLSKNFDPGIMGFFRDELGLSDAEIDASNAIWREYTSRHVPEFFPGLLELFAAHKAAGGLLVVVSHSDAPIIERDYRAAGAESLGAMPDLIFGWDDDPGRRKPDPYPLRETMRRLGVSAEDMLVVDDLKPGADMARAAGADFAAAAWGHEVPEIRRAMRGLCVYFLERAVDLAPYLLGDPQSTADAKATGV